MSIITGDSIKGKNLRAESLKDMAEKSKKSVEAQTAKANAETEKKKPGPKPKA